MPLLLEYISFFAINFLQSELLHKQYAVASFWST